MEEAPEAPVAGALGWARWAPVHAAGGGLHLARVEAVSAAGFDCEWIGAGGQRTRPLPFSEWVAQAPDGPRPAYVGVTSAASQPPKLAAGPGPVPSGEHRDWVGTSGKGLGIGSFVGPGFEEGHELKAALKDASSSLKSLNHSRGVRFTNRGSSGRRCDNARLKCTHGMEYHKRATLLDLSPGATMDAALVAQAAAAERGSLEWHAACSGRATGSAAQRLCAKGVEAASLMDKHLGGGAAAKALESGGDLSQAVEEMMARGIGVAAAMPSI